MKTRLALTFLLSLMTAELFAETILHTAVVCSADPAFKIDSYRNAFPAVYEMGGLSTQKLVSSPAGTRCFVLINTFGNDARAQQTFDSFVDLTKAAIPLTSETAGQ